ncbi:DEAD/DEAH box helicase, partial [Candidatus Peregrinibacteria bacterium]|nr:DEAD/DEAH box helicase [Candidatus Peregrinibacteria bacterium]
KGLHGDMEQGQRREVIEAFQKGKIDTLIATDVAARGLDIQGVTHVFNFHIPFEADSYVHRIGRTGRAGEKGSAITLVTPREFRALQRIKQSVGSNMSNKLVPSLEDIRKMNGTKLFKAIQKQDVHPSVKEFIQILGQEIEEGKITEKLMSYILEQEVSEGPERIGVPEHRLKRFVADFERPGGQNFSSSRRPFQGRRPFRGGGRGRGGDSRGGGGYRGFSRDRNDRGGPRRGR